jgi:hypothetical protein
MVKHSTSARPGTKSLLADLREMILTARQSVAQGVNSALVLLYWKIGKRIRTDILRNQRADYGERIVHSMGGKLTAEFGRGFTRTNLFNMVRFAEVFPDPRIVHALSGQLSWTHLRRIIYLDDPLKRDPNWLKRNEKQAEEHEPLGIILCAGKTAQHVELLELARSGIHVASYLTKILPKAELERKLHEAVRLSRARLQELRSDSRRRWPAGSISAF